MEFSNVSFFEKEKSDDWKWSFKDYPRPNGLKVFSLFACGGGSTMGYKLAGCEVLGCVEIDTKMIEIYKLNHHPKYPYCMDIREFNKLEDLPEELYDLDILDMSPPCTTFSMAGKREEGWGKQKKFREGQAEQTLDDLSFVAIDTVAKLRPKVAVMENVEGLLCGNAWSYVQRIYKQFKSIGYKVKHWLVKGETMGIPQTRHRVIFVATRVDFDLDKVNMAFNYEYVTYDDIRVGIGRPISPDSKIGQIALQWLPGERNIAETRERIGFKRSNFQVFYVRDYAPLPTLRTHNDMIDIIRMCWLTVETLQNAQTFPQDFNWGDNGRTTKEFVLGMSVPPVMMKRVATKLIESGIFNITITNKHNLNV